MSADQELERMKKEFRRAREFAIFKDLSEEEHQQLLIQAAQLREFCITNGQDLASIDAFLEQVEDEAQRFVPS